MTGALLATGFEYRKPLTLTEALRMLKNRHGDVRIFLAGGTDLILQMKRGLAFPSAVINVKDIPELNRLRWTATGGLHIGAAVPLARLVAFPALSEKYGILAQACSVIGSAQIRNRGTMGGNICNAAPSADSAPALLCLGAKAIVTSPTRTREIDLDEFFTGPGKTVVAADEILVEVEIPTPPARSAGCYMRHTIREEMDIAMVGVGSFMTLAPRSNRLKEVRIALGAVAPTPMRAYNAEAALTGKIPARKTIEEAAEKAAEEANPITDIRASAEYRREIVKVLARRTMSKCCETLGIDVQP